MKKTLLAVCALGLAAQLSCPVSASPDIEGLIRQMTLAEKFGQLQQLDGLAEGDERPEHPAMIREGRLGSTLNVRGAARTNRLQRIAMEQQRVKIPVLFAFDVIHGYRTIFPVPLGEAASFDLVAAEQSAAIAAAESFACGVRWVFAPMVDIARDPRWGRVVEGAGEDVFLGAAMARARVQGFQRGHKVVACAKHWCAYGRAEAGRDYNSVDVSERSLREVYFPPFKAAVDAGVGTLMSSFNDINGVPATANRFTLTDVLRGEWKFGGFVVSDYTSVHELLEHGVAADGAEATVKSLNAGTDMEMVSTDYAHNGPALVKSGRLKEAVVDEAVRRILRVKAWLGLFDNPYCDEKTEAAALLTPASRRAAREIAARSLVLLKNQGLLPLSKDLKRIAVVGPLGDSQLDMIGSWSGDGRKEDAVSLLAGLRNKFPQASFQVASGCDTKGGELQSQQVQAALNDAEVVIVAVGESADQSGEASSRSNLELPGRQLELLKLVHASGKPYVVVLMNGRPLLLNWLDEHAPAILETWFAGTEGGNAIADVLSGDVNPSGKLPITFPRSLGQVPIYASHKNTGRPFDAANKYTSKYLDVSNEPLYPFGFGLSYTQFGYSALQVKVLSASSVEVGVNVTNQGTRSGAEVVQLYLRDRVASIARPVRELKGFQRVSLEPQQTQRVTFRLGSEELGLLNERYQRVVEPGQFDVWVGGSSRAPAHADFKL